MRVKNLSPFAFGFRATSLVPPQPQMTVIMRGRFQLIADGISAVAPSAEGLEPLVQGQLLEAEYADADAEPAECIRAGDFADHKPRVDLLLRGSCHVPGGEPVPRCHVEWQVGDWSKRLWVFGDRQWSGDRPREARPFVKMELLWRRAAGGLEHPLNPCGVSPAAHRLPNIELPGKLIRRRTDRPPPAGFGPLSVRCPARRAKLGEHYDGRYRSERAPYYADDFDWAYFNDAPADQQLMALNGDEWMTMVHLHPEHRRLRCRLPGLRARAFVKTVARAGQEVPMRLDTVFVDIDEMAVWLSWRGQCDVDEVDLSDVTSVLLAHEPLAAPQDAAIYCDQLDTFEADPLRDAVPEAVRPAWDAVQGGGSAEAGGSVSGTAGLLQGMLSGIAPAAGAQLAQMLDQLGQQGVSGEWQRAAASRAQQAPPATAPGVPGEGFAGVSKELARLLDALKQRRDVTPEQTAPIEAARKQLPPPSPERVEIGPGRDLAGCDLSGRDLRGADLDGCDLTAANLSRARLCGARLRGAVLERALLFAADLSDADMRAAVFSHANLSQVVAERARFDGARLNGVVADRGRFDEAVLDGSQARHAIFNGACMNRASFRRCQWRRCWLDGVELDAARLVEAVMTKCCFAHAVAPQSDWSGATLDGSSFEAADLTRARFRAVVGAGSVWLEAGLERADFRHSVMTDAFFGSVRAAQVCFDGADLKGARFVRATLNGANFRGARLMAADLRHALLRDSCLVSANLFGAVALDADLHGADLRDARHEQSTLELR